MILLLIVRILNESGKKKVNFTYFLFISKDFRKSESSSCKSSPSSGGRILFFQAFILMVCMAKKNRKKKRLQSVQQSEANWRNPREKKSSVVLMAASQRKLPLIIFCAQCVVRWCSLVFYKSKCPFTLMPANEELLKSANDNSRWLQFRVDNGKQPLPSMTLNRLITTQRKIRVPDARTIIWEEEAWVWARVPGWVEPLNP